jgi:hypothetical protein
MLNLQYDLFDETPDEMDILKEEIKTIKDSNEKVRKGLFARYNELVKLYIEQKTEIENLKWMIGNLTKIN